MPDQPTYRVAVYTEDRDHANILFGELSWRFITPDYEVHLDEFPVSEPITPETIEQVELQPAELCEMAYNTLAALHERIVQRAEAEPTAANWNAADNIRQARDRAWGAFAWLTHADGRPDLDQMAADVIADENDASKHAHERAESERKRGVIFVSPGARGTAAVLWPCPVCDAPVRERCLGVGDNEFHVGRVDLYDVASHMPMPKLESRWTDTQSSEAVTVVALDDVAGDVHVRYDDGCGMAIDKGTFYGAFAEDPVPAPAPEPEPEPEPKLTRNQQRILAYETAETAWCPFCGARVGHPCLTSSNAKRKAPHQRRVKVRLAEIRGQL